VNVDGCLSLLAKPKNSTGKPFINRYSVGGINYIQIVNWNKHQKPHHTEKESSIPAPSENLPPVKEKEKGMEKGMEIIMEKQQEATAKLSTGDSTVISPLFNIDEINDDGDDVKTKLSISFNYETRQFENITIEDEQQWSEAYPAVDIKKALKQMGVWLISNPDKRKSKWGRFITNWLCREQERGGGAAKKLNSNQSSAKTTRNDVNSQRLAGL
jgi:hypothetical protein